MKPSLLTLAGLTCLLAGTLAAQPEVPVDLSSPAVQEARQRGAILSVETPAATLQVDGDLKEWGEPFGSRGALLHQSMNAAAFVGLRWFTAPEPAGPPVEPGTDAACIRFATDGEAIYIAARVVDNKFMPALPSRSVWDGDAVGVLLDFRAFDGEGMDRLGDWNTWSQNPPHGVFGFAAGLEADGSARVERAPNAREITGMTCVVKPRDFGYDLEARIPLSGLAYTRGMEGHISAERLKQAFGVALAVSDRDGPGPDARIGTTCWTVGPDDAPWGLALPVGAPAERSSLLFSGPRLQNGRRFFRAGAFVPLGALDARPKLSLELEPLRFPTPFKTLAFEGESTPFRDRSLAQAPELTVGDEKIDPYPALGAALVRRDLEVRALPPGPIVATAQFGPQVRRNVYILDNRNWRLLPPGSLEAPAGREDALKAMRNAWWGYLPIASFVVHGEAARGDVIP
jgi:hypothetical protein